MSQAFSKEQISLAANRQFIEQKNLLLRKVEETFRQIGMKNQMSLPVESSPDFKVSKGEQLKNLPFRVLDYPRIFEKNNTLAFRTLFWWGKYLSVTLHLKGSYLSHFLTFIGKNHENQPLGNYYVALSEDEWNHDLESNGYTLMNIDELIQLKAENIPFLKICQKLELNQINEIARFQSSHYNNLLNPFDGKY